ncbi:MAG: winged helix-turn-helix transcriptional regulator [Candidatus Fermentibacteraceae bacterium]|nr:winged helix-turn-helix transcriptional regulator [Candidatus Fermentibacteraceae bacterium]
MNSEELQFYRKQSETLKALANPYRLWMVEKLSEGETCVCEFNRVLTLDYSTISRHLSVLRRAGIVDYRKNGKQVYYSLRTPCVLGFLSCFDQVVQMNVKQETEYLNSREHRE